MNQIYVLKVCACRIHKEKKNSTQPIISYENSLPPMLSCIKLMIHLVKAKFYKTCYKHLVVEK